MNSGRLVSSSLLARRLSNLSLASSAAARRKPSSSTVTTVSAYRAYSAVAAARYNNSNNSSSSSSSHHHTHRTTTTRRFAHGGKKGSRTPGFDDDEGYDAPDYGYGADEDTDFFGVTFDDGDDPGKLGPEGGLPPLYKRDAATGRFTGEVEMELSEEQHRIIESDDYQRSKLLMQRLEAQWKKANTTDSTSAKELNALGQRIRENNLSLNVLGRSVEAQAATERAEDGSETGRDDEHGFMQRLTQQEFESFRAYMKKRYKVDVSEDEMPVLLDSSNNNSNKTDESLDEALLATKWMTAQAQRQVDERLDDNPYADLMPADMSPSRLVNRKKAKSIPVPLLHHNNIPLLQSFLTETAQIRSRVQTRLGARDQRRVSRLVKRARCLGLIPYQGQFRSEQHGWVHARDIDQKRPWEKELERRGLVIQNKMTTTTTTTTTNMENTNNSNNNTTATQGGEQAA